MMFAGLPLVLIALAQSAGAAPNATPVPPVASVPVPIPDDCRTPPPTSDSSRTIVVCAQKPHGYRLDPDVMEARKEARNRNGGPKPRELMRDNPCTSVGPMGCRGNAGIDLVSAAGVLAEMAARASRGENVGKMFETDPQPSEYQLYVEAKKRREAKEAAAAAKAKAAQAQKLSTASTPVTSQTPSQ